MSVVIDRASRHWVVQREADDPWVHSVNGTDWDSHYEQLTSASFHGHITEAWLGPVQVFYEEVNSPFHYHGQSWQGSQILFAALPGTGDVYYDNRPVPANSFVTHRWDSFERMSCNGGYKAVFIAMEEDFLRQYCERVAGRRYLSETRNVLFSVDPATVGNFQRNILRVLRELAASPQALASEHGRVALEDAVLGTVMDALEASSESSARLPPPTTRAYIVDKAVELMEARLAEAISLADICAAIRISPRTLRYSFEEILGISPTRYLLTRRLNRVRRELLGAGRETAIEDVAARWGFWHMGRFAQFYRQSFGERPSDTRRCAQPSAA